MDAHAPWGPGLSPSGQCFPTARKQLQGHGRLVVTKCAPCEWFEASEAPRRPRLFSRAVVPRVDGMFVA